MLAVGVVLFVDADGFRQEVGAPVGEAADHAAGGEDCETGCAGDSVWGGEKGEKVREEGAGRKEGRSGSSCLGFGEHTL